MIQGQHPDSPAGRGKDRDRGSRSGGGGAGASPGAKNINSPGGKASPKGSTKGSPKPPNAQHTFLTATHSGKLKLCKRYNDPRGCKAPCPNNDTHACDVLLQGDKACASKAHTRAQHNDARDGKGQTKP
jgi:hypothetical protein